MIKMVKEFKLNVVHFARPNPVQMCACAWIYRWIEKLPGLRAFGPPGRRAVAGRWPRAAGPSGRWAAGPWRAVGRGPLGRGPAFSKTRNKLVSQINTEKLTENHLCLTCKTIQSPIRHHNKIDHLRASVYCLRDLRLNCGLVLKLEDVC